MGDTAQKLTAFENLLFTHRNHFGLSLFLLLSWIAACDGDTSPDEVEALSDIGGRTIDPQVIARLIRIAQTEDLAAIQLACEIVRAGVQAQSARNLFSLMISIAIADGYLRPSENHILRLYADLMGISASDMDLSFKEVTGKPFPSLPDLSSAPWWQSRGHDGRQQQSSSSKSQTASSQPDFSRLRALAMLGLDEGATELEIKSAYRRLVQVHHPDRFNEMGADATKAAAASFRRIKEAYDLLMSNA